MSKGQATITTLATTVPLGGTAAPAPSGTLLDRQSVGVAPTAWLHANTEAETPPWQRDTGFCDAAKKSARSERRAIILSLIVQARMGVIIDTQARVIEGTPGWVSHVAQLPTLRMQHGQIAPVSVLSQSDFYQAIARFVMDQTVGPVSVLLRDLDGWGADLLQMTRVGTGNPSCILLLLPKSLSDAGAMVRNLSETLGLTKREVTIATLVLEGRIDLEIASSLGIEPLIAKRAIASLLGKFRVRRRSDLVRLFSRLA